jgi:hypothetical protein
LSEEAVNASSRQAHDVREGAVHRLDETRAEALNGVGAGLVAGLPGRDVPADLLLVERRDPHAAFFDRGCFRTGVPEQGHGGDHNVFSSGEAPQHLGGLSVVPRFPEYGAIDQDERVGREDPALRVERGGRGGLRAGQTHGRFPAGLAREERLVDVGSGDGERDSERAENLRAAGRGRREQETRTHSERRFSPVIPKS